MNNRQKAKHFKKLYEAQLLKPVPIVIQHESLQKFEACYHATEEYMAQMPNEEFTKKWVVKNLLEQLQPFVATHLVCEKDPYMRTINYYVDFYARR